MYDDIGEFTSSGDSDFPQSSRSILGHKEDFDMRIFGINVTPVFAGDVIDRTPFGIHSYNAASLYIGKVVSSHESSPHRNM